MLRCKKCGYRSPRYDIICPECSTIYELTESECEELLAEANERLSRNDFIRAVDIYKLLASVGNREGERELALFMKLSTSISV